MIVVQAFNGGGGPMFKRRDDKLRQVNDPKEYDPLIVDAIIRGQFSPGTSEHAELAAACQIMQTQLGLSVGEIAERLNVQERRVYRALDTAVEAMEPLDIPEFDHSPLRQERLQDMALQVMGLATEFRNGPLAVWDEVKTLEAQQLRELLMVACAMIPVDAPARRLLKWVEEMPSVIGAPA